jgi:hypothetical protein
MIKNMKIDLKMEKYYSLIELNNKKGILNTHQSHLIK